jgi:hypothetical protein
MPEETQHSLESRIVRLETIIGDRDSGLMSEVHGIKQTLEELKRFQYRLFGAMTVIVAVIQAIFRMTLK